ncbi:Glycosyl hydrolase family 109 protein 1 [Porphyromonas levii]|nr:Glycosyl hydrolase family 109 protein 1 [Porphyromonas levii]
MNKIDQQLMMKRIVLLMSVLALVLSACGTTATLEKGAAAVPEVIMTKVPVRPEGQHHMVNFAAPKMDKVRIGVIGLGMRGPGAVERFCFIPGAEVVALCDIHQDRVEKSNKILEKNGKPKAAEYFGSEDAWKQLVERDDLDLIYIVTDWRNHVPMALYAMEQGKHVAVEVPAAHSLEDIWALINTAERTQKHCMMLENCVYDFYELTILNMVQKGLLGEIVYAEGGYIHQLEEFWNYYEGDWRMTFNKQVSGDVYATHGMGPAAQVMNLHRGDKMNYLVSMDADPVSIPEWLKKNRNEVVSDFQNGQHTLTLIRTEKGKTIEMHHDVATPRPYSRQYNVAGTKGYASKYPMPLLALKSESIDNGVAPDHENLNSHSWLPKEVQEKLLVQNKHRIHTELEEKAKQVGGHGGMDFIMDYRLIYCLINGLPLDMDVYDMAEWSCISPLSRLSIEHNSAPVAVPDFTRGYWNLVDGYHHAFVD